jgi:hypothetical protein
MLNSLADEHPIERITMKRAQLVKIQHGPLAPRARSYAMTLTMRHDELIESSGKRQPTESMLH